MVNNFGEQYKICAIDTKKRKTALRYARKLKQRVDLIRHTYAIKIGLISIIDNGLSIINELKKITKLPIICDLKIADVPHIAADISEKVYAAGADGIVIQGFVGKEVIKHIKARTPYLHIYLVSEMSHNAGGYTSEHLEDFCKMAKDFQLEGIIGPGERPERIQLIKNSVKDGVNDKTKIIAVGIANKNEEDEAIKHGADLIMEGREYQRLLDKQDVKKLLGQIGIYAGVAFILSLLLTILLPDAIKKIAEPPLVNIFVSTSMTMTGVVIGFLKGDARI
ncbi:MAG: orotidine 5'-phosphate decarboxylase / HUMPS family protein [Thermodesulfovibrionales bacterium]|nr:orotidine 5'-phosphate decarboxylase / HUMPS family protein [Thermodesulfovibrionales bacterium]